MKKILVSRVTEMLESLDDPHGDGCRCDGCMNVNFRRPQAVIDAELRVLAEAHCTPDMVDWLKGFRPEAWA